MYSWPRRALLHLIHYGNLSLTEVILPNLHLVNPMKQIKYLVVTDFYGCNGRVKHYSRFRKVVNVDHELARDDFVSRAKND